MSAYPRIARFRSVDDLRRHLAALGTPIPLDDEPLSTAAGSPFARPLTLGGRAGFATLLAEVKNAHREAFGRDDDLVVALQLTHSGRFSKPVASGRIPRIAYHHPLLDARHGVHPADAACVLTDTDVERLIDAYVAAAQDADAAGFDMVDLKACHGYLVHEFLSARRRPGRFGGDFTGRTRLLTTLIERVTAECPRLLVGVRLSLFDVVPWHMVDGHGEPCSVRDSLPYDCGFGVNERNPLEYDVAEPIALLKVLRDLGVCAVNLTAGSPYTVPHIQRPAARSPTARPPRGTASAAAATRSTPTTRGFPRRPR